MAKRQREWNQFEAVILLDGLLDVLKGTAIMGEVVARVSKDLRDMALKQGEKIDDFFRNEVGIYAQIQRMKAAFETNYASNRTTKLFVATVNLYRKNYQEYMELLEAAKRMIRGEMVPAIDNEDSLKAKFIEYMKAKVSPSQLNESFWYYEIIDEFCIKEKVLNNSLLETTDLDVLKNVKDTIEHSTSFRFSHKGMYSNMVVAFYNFYSYVKNFYKSDEKAAEPNLNSANHDSVCVDSGIHKTNDSILRTKDDERLSSKYPIAFKRIFHVLQESVEKNEGLSLNEIHEQIQRIARISDVEDILDNASWADFKGGKYWFSSTIVDHSILDSQYDYEGTKSTENHDNIQSAQEKKENLNKELLCVAESQKDYFNNEKLSNYRSTNDEYVVKYHNEPYEKILSKNFHRGFRLDSAIEIRRFRKGYYDAYGRELEDDDGKILFTIIRLCVINNDRAYLPEEILDGDIKSKLLNYIDKSFNEGKKVLYYSALCNEFEEDFLDSPLYKNPELLKQYLEEVEVGKYFLNKKYISQDLYTVPDPLTEIKLCLINNDRPMKLEEIYKELPHLPHDKIKNILWSNVVFINNGTAEYFHESILRLTDEELESIAEIIDSTIEEKNFISGNELYDAIGKKYPYIVDEYQEISFYGLRDALKVKFGRRYSFNGNIISKPGNQLSMSDVFGDFAKSHESFTLSELKTLAKELGVSVYFEPVYENSIRVSKDLFVSCDQANFDVAETDTVLDLVCPGNYISIQKVTNFGIFPDAGHPWNSYLLEEYVAEYSDKYMLLHVGFTQNGCAGAIVKRSARIDTFDDFIVDLLSITNVELNKDEVLSFLVNEGYLARHRYSNIEEIIIKARAQRKNKE